MSGPLVSVVIPCYRQAHYLPAALASVFAQTHTAVEAVVVNDGSDDDTDAVARSFLPRIRYVSQPNAGLPAARNAGIAAASGEYLLFLDADDLLGPEAVAWLVEAVAGCPDRLAACGWRTFRAAPDAPDGRDHFPDPGPLFPRLIHDNPVPCHAVLCSRALADRVGGFEPSLRACEDWDFWARATIAGADFVVVPRVGVYYRQGAASMSRDRLRMLEARLKVLKRACDAMLARPDLLARWGPDLAAAALRVRRRLRAQNVYPQWVTELTEMLDDLARRGHFPPLAGKEAVLARVVGRECADRLVLAYYRRFDKPMFEFYQQGHA